MMVDRMRVRLLSRQGNWEDSIMPHIKTSDGVQLYYEETGEGAPLIFLHEFGGHYMSWEPQVRYFSRRYRCITYAARGWPPSDVPDDVAMYSQARAADDCADLMKALGIDKAHLCGLSMGATAGLEFAIRHPGKATVAGDRRGRRRRRDRSRGQEALQGGVRGLRAAHRAGGHAGDGRALLHQLGAHHLPLQGPARLGRVQAAVRRRLGQGPRHDHARRAGRARRRSSSAPRS